MAERVEIIMRRERRRSFSVEEKLRIVEETRAAGATVREVARRHDVAESLLYVWRRMAQGRAAQRRSSRHVAVAQAAPVQLVPVRIEGPASAPAAPRALGGRIEIALPGGVKVKVDAEVDPERLGLVLAHLRRR
ncbi:MAG: IS66-like element accessory protein TnpA [Caulobacteraceae bacterium]